MTDLEIHDVWLLITEGGNADSRVNTVERLFSELRTGLRAKFNTPVEILDELDAVREKAVARVKREIVVSAHWNGLRQART